VPEKRRERGTMGERQASLCQVGAMGEAGRAGISRESEWPRMPQTQTHREVGRKREGERDPREGDTLFREKNQANRD
jgi:hypothetical protein